MRLLCWLRNHPIVLLGIILAGLGTWIASDLTHSPQQQPAPGVPTGVVQLAQMTMDMPDHAVPARTTPAVPVDKISKLKPGMSRVAVESFLGAPRPDQPGPIYVQDGRATYQTTYPIDLDVGPTNTVRLAHPPRPPAPVGLTTECVLTLEFDASRPGHPLLSVRYPNELF